MCIRDSFKAVLMKILKSWLNDWIDIENISNSDISEALESLGFEIDNKKELNPNYENIVVGKVLEVYEHPNADKVRITKLMLVIIFMKLFVELGILT